MTTTPRTAPNPCLELAFAFHGHTCPAMPMGLRAGAAALGVLGVARATDRPLTALVESNREHGATCFADGVQMITGCTLGKGTVPRLLLGKWRLTLIHKQRGRAFRVAPHADMMKSTKETLFSRNDPKKGIPASAVPARVVTPLIERVMGLPTQEIFQSANCSTTSGNKTHAHSRALSAISVAR